MMMMMMMCGYVCMYTHVRTGALRGQKRELNPLEPLAPPTPTYSTDVRPETVKFINKGRCQLPGSWGTG